MFIYMSKYKDNKLVAFDFDHTLSKKHVTCMINKSQYMYSSITDAVDEILSNENDILCDLFYNSAFVDLLRYYKSSKNAKYVIVSFGYAEAIDKILKYNDIRDLFDDIYTPSRYECYDGCDCSKVFDGKNKMIFDAMNSLKITRNDNVLLIDDSYVNIYYADNKDFDTLFVKNGMLEVSDGNKIINFLNQ